MAEELTNAPVFKTEEEKIVQQLRESWYMYEKTKQDTMEERRIKAEKLNIPFPDQATMETIKLLETRQAQIADKFAQFGGNPEDLKPLENEKETRKKKLKEILNKQSDIDTYLSTWEDDKNDSEVTVSPDSEVSAKAEVKVEEPVVENVVDAPRTDFTPAVGMNSQPLYDMVKLPSKGQCYKHKMGNIPVAYLTAYDENLMVSPNLYEDGSFLDELLKLKILNNKVVVDDLLPGDRDAIILWLRASGYGVKYPINVTDSEGNTFDTTADLSQIKFKPFELVGDDDGYFSYTLPLSGDEVKFKFLTIKDVKELVKMDEKDDKATRKSALLAIASNLREAFNDDEDIEDSLRKKLNGALKAIEEYSDTISDTETLHISHTITNKLIKSVVSVNNITDRKYIARYVTNMNVKDAWALRKHIINNEPGLDFNITVERPESLGGGSVSVFLQLDKDIFFTIVE